MPKLPTITVKKEFYGWIARYETSCGHVEQKLPEWTTLDRIKQVVREFMVLPLKSYRVEVVE